MSPKPRARSRADRGGAGSIAGSGGHRVSVDACAAAASSDHSTEGKPVIGWREWVRLPELGVQRIKAKIDTGARSSALHAYDVEIVTRDGCEHVAFKVLPYQRSGDAAVHAEARLLEYRRVRNSGGHVEERPVIETLLELGGRKHMIEVTLTSRDEMGFRMLLGRQAVRRDFVVDPGRSFLHGGGERRRSKR